MYEDALRLQRNAEMQVCTSFIKVSPALQRNFLIWPRENIRKKFSIFSKLRIKVIYKKTYIEIRAFYVQIFT